MVAAASCAVLVSLPGRPRLCAPVGVVIGIVVGAVVGVLIAGGASLSLASYSVNVNAALSTPVGPRGGGRREGSLFVVPAPLACKFPASRGPFVFAP